jgi:hypothetical protein
MVFRSEAEVRWLNHCESSLTRYSATTTSSTSGAHDDRATDSDVTREATAR